jgi:hypothetical protein
VSALVLVKIIQRPELGCAEVFVHTGYRTCRSS